MTKVTAAVEIKRSKWLPLIKNISLRSLLFHIPSRPKYIRSRLADRAKSVQFSVSPTEQPVRDLYSSMLVGARL